MKLVIDTSAWIEYFLGTKKGELVNKIIQEYELITPSIVLLELSYKADKEKWNLKKHIDFINLKSKISGFDEKFVLEFGRVYNEVKSKVKDIGLADAIILNTARLNDAKILTGDKHFEGFHEAIMLSDS